MADLVALYLPLLPSVRSDSVHCPPDTLQSNPFRLLLSVCPRYATPFGLTSEYAHPAEILFLGFATILGPALTGPHLLTLWIWMSVRVLETVEAHSGFDFPWSPSHFIPFYGG